MATHFVHNRARHRAAGKFASKQDAFRSAVRVYVCLECGQWHMTKQARCSNPGCAGECQHFSSKTEATRYAQLRLMQEQGYISALELQPRFPVRVKGVLLCTYIADFRYQDARGNVRIEDTKASKKHSDPASALRRRLAEVLYDMTVNIIAEK